MYKTKWERQFLMGTVDNEKIYLSAPSWDCDWYWGFGYLGNDRRHYHFDSLMKDTNLWQGVKDHFKDLRIPDKQLWTFSELIVTAYTLRKTAEVLGRGGSHYTVNPCFAIIQNKNEAKRINEIVLPNIFDEIHNLLF